jgi:hypothetical protein
MDATFNKHQNITSVCFQIITLQSSLQLATMFTGMAVLGAHATSRTQSIENIVIDIVFMRFFVLSKGHIVVGRTR